MPNSPSSAVAASTASCWGCMPQWAKALMASTAHYASAQMSTNINGRNLGDLGILPTQSAPV